jgi:hypothetical protein
MKTTDSNWYIVTVMNEDELIGEVLWGIVIDDPTCRFVREDYVCTSQILRVNIGKQIIETATGICYQALGKGQKAINDFDDFELLRHGFGPQQIKALNQAKAAVAH